MSSSNLVRLGGGLASAAAGVLLLLGHVLNPGGDPEYGTMPGGSLVLAAHVALIFALVALYAAQADESGLLGSLGMVLGVIGTTLVSGVVLVEIAGASGAEVDAVFAAGDFFGSAAPIIFVVGAAITCTGFVWLGVALLSGRSGVSAQQSGRVS